jgi:hypothetical protein
VRVEGERWEAEAGLGRFDRPRTWPVRLDQLGWLGQANGPRPIYKSKSVFKIWKLCFPFWINSNPKLNQFCLI